MLNTAVDISLAAVKAKELVAKKRDHKHRHGERSSERPRSADRSDGASLTSAKEGKGKSATALAFSDAGVAMDAVVKVEKHRKHKQGEKSRERGAGAASDDARAGVASVAAAPVADSTDLTAALDDAEDVAIAVEARMTAMIEEEKAAAAGASSAGAAGIVVADDATLRARLDTVVESDDVVAVSESVGDGDKKSTKSKKHRQHKPSEADGATPDVKKGKSATALAFSDAGVAMDAVVKVEKHRKHKHRDKSKERGDGAASEDARAGVASSTLDNTDVTAELNATEDVATAVEASMTAVIEKEKAAAAGASGGGSQPSVPADSGGAADGSGGSARIRGREPLEGPGTAKIEAARKRQAAEHEESLHAATLTASHVAAMAGAVVHARGEKKAKA